MKIKNLGYIGIGAPDPAKWLMYGTEILGLMPSRALPGESWGVPAVPNSGPESKGSGIGEDGSVYLKMDDYQWRIAVHPNPDNSGIMYLGFEMQSAEDLLCVVNELNAAGHEAYLGSDEQARKRSVKGIVISKDPAGNVVEFFYGPTLDFNFESPLNVEFVTGSLGLGHINLFVNDLQANQDFYVNCLGFNLTDYIEFAPGQTASFYHCNQRHHTLGLMKVSDFDALHHLMLEVKDVDQVGRCLDRVENSGIKVTSTLGRHKNDNMLSFYMSSPFGFEVEIGCEGALVDEHWTPRQFVEGDIWGHKGLDPESIQEIIDQIKV